MKLNQLVGSAAKDRRLLGFVVFVNGAPEALERLAAERQLANIGLAYLKEGRDFSPQRQNVARLYKLDPTAQNTVIVYHRGKVVANFVDLDAGEFDKVEQAVARVMR